MEILSLKSQGIVKTDHFVYANSSLSGAHHCGTFETMRRRTLPSEVSVT